MDEVKVIMLTALIVGVISGSTIGYSLTKLDFQEKEYNKICKYNGFDKEIPFTSTIIKNKEYVLCEKIEVIDGNVITTRLYINTKPDMICYELKCSPIDD